MVPDLQKQEAYHYNNHNGPEVDERCRENSGVAVGQDSEVVTLDVAEGQQKVLPAPFELKVKVAARRVAKDSVGEIDKREQDIVEQRLEGGDRGAFIDEKGSEGVRCS